MSWPQWSIGNIQNVNAGAAALPLLAQTATAATAATVLPGNTAQYTPEQWTQIQQQNWQQWAQWQQQYQQWQQQYGAEFQKSLSAMNTHAASTLSLTSIMPNTSVPPPLPNQPVENKPPLPPEEPPTVVWQAQTPKATTNYSSLPSNQTNNYNSSNESNNWNRGNSNWQNQNQQRNQRNFTGNKINFSNKSNYKNDGVQQEAATKRPINALESTDSKKIKFEFASLPQTDKPSDWLSSSKPASESKPASSIASNESTEEISEAEKKFIKQFADWESQFAEWKKQNQDHPNKALYREYEKKWEAWRAQLLERREQMKKKRLMKIGNQLDKNGKPIPSETQQTSNLIQSASTTESKPQQQKTSNEGESSFLLSPNSKNEIPGLDLVKDDNAEDQDNKVSTKSQEMDAISKGIVSILSDQKILNMLSLVTQNQSIVQSKTTDSVPNITQSSRQSGNASLDGVSLINEQQNQSHDDYSQSENFSNIDDHTRTSFASGQFDNDTKSPRSDYNVTEDRADQNYFFNTERTDDFRRNPANVMNRSEENNVRRDFGRVQTAGRNEGRNFGRFNRQQDERGDDVFDNANNSQNFYNRFDDRKAPLDNKNSESNSIDDRMDFNKSMENVSSRETTNFNKIIYSKETDPFDRTIERKNYNSDMYLNLPTGSGEIKFPENKENNNSNYRDDKSVVIWSKETDSSFAGESLREDLLKSTADEIWKPTNVIDYDHKSLKSDDFNVIIETFYTFDYHHKPVNRIPYPERPKWLANILSNYREFEPQIKRVFERYPERFERRPYQDTYRRYDCYKSDERYPKRDYTRDYEDRGSHETSRYNDGYDKKMPDDGGKFSTNNKKSSEFERRPFSSVHRRSFNDRDANVPTYSKSNARNENFDSDKSPADDEEDDDDPFPDFEAFAASKSNVDFKPPEESTKRDVVLIEDILNKPGRFSRPPRIVIMLRGPPGSGKTFLAKLIKDKEVENGGSPPRILSLDDYFMVEQEKDVQEDGRTVKVKEMVYEYEEDMEKSYKVSLLKSFKKTITDGYFPFIVVDNVNDRVADFSEMWSFAKQNGFQVYTCELELDVQLCTKRNVHGRTEAEIERCVREWEPTPSHYCIIDATSLIQAGSIPEVEMEEINSPAQNDYGSDADDEDQVRSKWDTFDCSLNNLAKLDGTSKPLRPSRTMEDYLQLDDEWFAKAVEPGKKRVRWADLEERKEQEKMRAIGFVVGQTNWNRMMDPTHGSSALTQTKYIERVRKY